MEAMKVTKSIALLIVIVLSAGVFGHSEQILTQPELRIGNGVLSTAAFSPDGKWIVSGSDSGIYLVWDAVEHTLVRSIESDPGSDFNDVDISPDSRLLLTWNDRYKVRIWDITDGTLVQTLQFSDERNKFYYGAFTGNGTQVVMRAREYDSNGDYEILLSIWDIETGERLSAIPSDSVRCFSPDGNEAISDEGKIFDVRTGTVLQTLPD